jgi:hypothetical protein
MPNIARLKLTLRYKTVMSFMLNKHPGNFAFKRNSVEISVIINYANEDLFVDSKSAHRQRATNLYCNIQTHSTVFNACNWRISCQYSTYRWSSQFSQTQTVICSNAIRQDHGFGVRSTECKKQSKRKKLQICLIRNEVVMEQWYAENKEDKERFRESVIPNTLQHVNQTQKCSS